MEPSPARDSDSPTPGMPSVTQRHSSPFMPKQIRRIVPGSTFSIASDHKSASTEPVFPAPNTICRVNRATYWRAKARPGRSRYNGSLNQEEIRLFHCRVIIETIFSRTLPRHPATRETKERTRDLLCLIPRRRTF
jgi:hypothetical protein